ncbi:hypothetical protein ACFX2B_014216 [Malus domestica]
MKSLEDLLALNVTRDHQALVCISLPPNIHSSGYWRNSKVDDESPYSATHPLSVKKLSSATLSVLEEQMALAFFLTQFLHLALRCFGIPVFVTQMLAGIILGPGMLGSIWPGYEKIMYDIVSQDVMGTLTVLGYCMFLFLMGVKMDIGIVLRTGRKALYTGAGSLLVPLCVGLFTLGTRGVFLNWELEQNDLQALALAVITNAQTSFTVIACLLGDLKLLTSELGRLALSSSIVSDILGLSLRTFTKLVMSTGKEGGFFRNTIAMLGYILVVYFGARPAMYWIIRQTPKGQPVHNGYLLIILIGVLCSALFSFYFNQYLFFGPFVLGLAVPEGPPLGSALVKCYDFMVSDILLPLFVTSNVWLMNPKDIKLKGKFAIPSLVLLIVSTVSKFGGSLLPALYCDMPLMDALGLALIMCCKGVVDLGSLSTVTKDMPLNEEIYAINVLGILMIACVVSLLLKHFNISSKKYGGYEQRNVACLKPNSELRILACIHKQNNISAVINFLDACCPTKESPISLYVLHLIEMFGQAAPIFISHRMQTKTLSNCSYSEDMLLSFLQFERDFSEAVTVQPFTAISPTKSMHEDTCTLALDRATSLIILPFHRHWILDGSIKSDDRAIRSLNISVLEKAPCSVGILINRGPLRQLSLEKNSSSEAVQYKVALIFLGGEDDREALALTLRMAADPSISLTVFYFTTPRDCEATNWDRIVDLQSLREYREGYVHACGSAFYVEKIAKNGPETVAILRSILNEYDLFVVGRRKHWESPQTSGLDEWSEFPELGIIGDMLASDDFRCRSSIFVVQQQQTT